MWKKNIVIAPLKLVLHLKANIVPNVYYQFMHFLATLRIDIFLWLNWVIVESNTILNAFYGN